MATDSYGNVTRSATNHAGQPAKVSTPYSYTSGGKTQIVASPGDGRKIKLIDVTWSTAAATGTANFCSSASTGGTGTTLTGELKTATAALPFQIKGDLLVGIGTCAAGEDLCVSGANGAGAGFVVYSLVP